MERIRAITEASINPTATPKSKAPCGDTMEMYSKIQNDKVIDAAYTTDGCMTSYAAGTAATVMAKGSPVRECMKINQTSILEHLGGMPDESALRASGGEHLPQGAAGLCRRQEKMRKFMLHSLPLSLAGWFTDYVNRYRAADGARLAPLELGYAHSRRVAQNAGLTARGLKHVETEVPFAEICGLLHDIGRFHNTAATVLP